MKKLEGITQEQKDALEFVLENVNINDPKLVITSKDIRTIDKLCSVIESSGDSLELEDSDFNYLKDKFHKFGMWNPAKETRPIVISVSDLLDGAK